MSYHNTDIAACGHATCPSRESCLRWVIGQRMDEYQCFGLFVPKDGKCDYYWETNEKVDDNEKIINLKRDKDGFLVGEVSDLDEYLPFSLHDSQDDSMTEIADADDLLDWSSDIDTKPKYDYIIAQDVAFDEVCNNYRGIFANWDELTFAEKRDKINDFRCGN